MKLPEVLERWTYQTILEIVQTYEYEPGEFDYKTTLNVSKRWDGDDVRSHREALNESIRKTACAMANTGGGYILFGVRDRAEKVSRPADRIVGIPLDGDLRKQFGDKVGRVIPALRFEASPSAIPVPGSPLHGVFVVRVADSLRRPHMANPPGIFYRRGAGGNAVPMERDQVRDQLLATEEQLRKVPLLQTHVAILRGMINEYLKQYRQRASHLVYGRIPTESLQIWLSGIQSLTLDPALLADLYGLVTLCGIFNAFQDSITRMPWYIEPTIPLHAMLARLPRPFQALIPFRIADVRGNHWKLLRELSLTCTRCEDGLAALAATLEPPDTPSGTDLLPAS